MHWRASACTLSNMKTASYTIHATNAALAVARFRVRCDVVRIGGNDCADVDAIHAAVKAALAAAKPGSGMWSYSVTARGEHFDSDTVTV